MIIARTEHFKLEAGLPAMVAPHLLARFELRELMIGPAASSGWILVMGGTLGYLWCVHNLWRVERGTPPSIDAPEEPVIQGPYRWSRNPIYVSVLLFVFGLAMILESLTSVIYGIVLWAGLHTYVRGYEEPHRARELRVPYERYCAAVPRWLGRPLQPERRGVDEGAAHP